jgi:hypothetical protein
VAAALATGRTRLFKKGATTELALIVPGKNRAQVTIDCVSRLFARGQIDGASEAEKCTLHSIGIAVVANTTRVHPDDLVMMAASLSASSVGASVVNWSPPGAPSF